MKTWIAVIVGALFVAVATRGAEPPVKQKLVVGEWSVVLLGDGVMEELPPFVSADEKGEARATIGTSLVQFRGAEGQELDVVAGDGKAVAAWPVNGPNAAGASRWRGALAKTPKVEPRPVPEAHGWGRLRERGLGMYLNVVGGASERFLFYRTPVRLRPMVRAAVTSDAITLTNSGENPSGSVVVIANDGFSRNGARVGSIGGKSEVTLSRAGMTEVSWDDRETLAAVEAQWRAAGLSELEAKAAVDVWREELLHRPGFLLISRMSPEQYEKAFPLTVNPEPAERVRAGMLFDTVADQKERASWLVNLDMAVAQWVRQYSEGDATRRSGIVRKLKAAGELAQPFLTELAKDSDVTLAKAAGELAKQLGISN